MSSGSPGLDGLIFNSINSPRFDIAEFLKTPRDGVLDEGFNIQSNHSLTMFPPFADFTQPKDPKAFGNVDIGFNVIFDKGIQDGCNGLENLMYGELSFDQNEDSAKDPFKNLTGISNDAISLLEENMLPLMNMSHSNLFQNDAFMELSSAGLVEVDECLASGQDPAALTSDGLNHPFPIVHNISDWGLHSEDLSLETDMAHYNLQCGSCQVLQYIIHSNGIQDTKLEIHGCDGQSYHAVLHTQLCIDDGLPTPLEQQMVEFPVGNAEYVKQFLVQYSLLRRKEGFVLRHDSNEVHDPDCGVSVSDASSNLFSNEACRASFPDFLGSDLSNNYGKPGLGQSNPIRSSSMDSITLAESSSVPVKPPKSNAAAQRERTGKLKMSDLAQHFHLPINAAAKELGICPTVLKKICRRNGMRRWPHRKIKSIERIISTLEQTIAEGAGHGDEGIRMEIAMLRNERAQLCAGLLGEN